MTITVPLLSLCLVLFQYLKPVNAIGIDAIRRATMPTVASVERDIVYRRMFYKHINCDSREDKARYFDDAGLLGAFYPTEVAFSWVPHYQKRVITCGV